MARGPNSKYAFKEIAQQGDHEPGPAHQTTDVFRADITAAEIADVLARSHANEVVTRCKATEKICPKPNPGCLGPVSRVQLFHPRHLFIKQLISNSRFTGCFYTNCVLCASKTYLAVGLSELSNSLLDALTSRVKQG